MDRVGRLLLAVLLISASACTVQGKVTPYSIQFYQTRRSPSDYTKIFGPPANEPVKNKGEGWATHYDAVSAFGEFLLGSVGGMEWYHHTDAVEYVETITFSANLGGIWNGSSLNLRGLWRRTADGQEHLPDQELSIVGGQGGLRGSRGSAYFKLVQTKPNFVFHVKCDVYVDDFKDLTPTIHLDLASLYKTGTELVHDSPATTETATTDVLKQVVGSP